MIVLPASKVWLWVSTWWRVYEAARHGPEIVHSFTGIRKWVLKLWKRPFWFSKKVNITLSLKWSMPYQGGCSQFVKGMNPAPHISRTFTTHNYGYGIAYTFTQNNITLEHTAMNDKNTIAHTDAYNTQFWTHCAPSVDATVVSHRTCGSRLPRVCHPCHPMHAHLWLVSWVVCLLPCVLRFLPRLTVLLPAPSWCPPQAYNERSMSNPLCYSSLGSVVTSDYVTPLTGSEPNQDLNLTNAEELEPRYPQRCLLPAHPGRHGFLPQRSRRRRQPACEIFCSCSR